VSTFSFDDPFFILLLCTSYPILSTINCVYSLILSIYTLTFPPFLAYTIYFYTFLSFFIYLIQLFLYFLTQLPQLLITCTTVLYSMKCKMVHYHLVATCPVVHIKNRKKRHRNQHGCSVLINSINSIIKT
jgi:hypothetical protein